MNPRFKFRCWDGYTMWFPETDTTNNTPTNLVFFNPDRGIKWGLYDSKFDNRISSGEHHNLMQWTGLKDRHGVDIYEGDILSVCNGSINGYHWMDKKPYAVEYVLNKGFDICMFCWDKDGQNIMDSTHWCEVIGNIYQTPEKLNNETNKI